MGKVLSYGYHGYIYSGKDYLFGNNGYQNFKGKTIHKEIMIMNIMEKVLFVTVIINLTGRYFIGKHDCDSYRLGIYLTSIIVDIMGYNAIETGRFLTILMQTK